STALVFNPLSPFTQLTTINTSITSPAADKRVDEMAFDPKDHRLLVVNDAATPHPYINLIDTTSNTVVQHTVLPTATAGIEQPFWDGATKKFYVSIPQVGGAGAGGIAVVDPLTGAVTNIFDLTAFVANCGPTGLTGAGHGQLLVACGNKGTQAILLDVSSGSAVLVKLFPQVSGSDQAWFDPASDRFFVTGANNIGGPILGIIDGSNDTFLQALRTATGAHSVAVDPGGDLYVPVGAGSGNPFCPTTGCIAVFDVGVPEPGSLPLIVTAMAGLIGLGLRRRSHR
ncbi:MAG: PEP-CTERM sorting domain-containing protein, partial [Acetobacteraceae bacterium]